MLFSAEGASRVGVGCCTPPLASNFRSPRRYTLRAAVIDVAAVEGERRSGEGAGGENVAAPLPQLA